MINIDKLSNINRDKETLKNIMIDIHEKISYNLNYIKI